MKNQIKSVVVLVCICLVVTILMAVTNQFTAPIIKENQNAAENAALLEVMPEGGSFEKVDLSAFTLPATVSEVYCAKNGGYVVKLTTTGYSAGMILLCGINADGTVSGVVCLESTETLGYEKTYGENFVGKNTESAEAVDVIAGATKTTAAYKSAIKDALNTAIILGGGSVDIRTEEEIFLDNLSATLPSAEGKFKQHFFVEVVEGVDAIYEAENKTGYVCIIGEQFIGADAAGKATTQCDEATAAKVSAAIDRISKTTTEDIDLTKYEGLPSQLISAKKTATENYIIEIKGAGYGIQGGDEYHPASNEYIVIRVSMTKDGKIIDCLTVSQAETNGIGSVCADESFYGQFDGKTEENYLDIDAISGATLTTNGYTKAIERAFKTVKIFEGGSN
ncbi:MAG: FMN-binding protein [Ruminococcaceae bacterium]|nr:FMN-binding protein [Oscillospiraceae bacterium]